MSAELTPWFSSSVSPVRAGLYQVKSSVLRRFTKGLGGSGDGVRYWTGKNWLICENGRPTNFGELDWLKDEWRGLASNPAKAKP